MLSTMDQMRHAQIWDLLGKYADIRDQLEDLFHSLRFLQQNIEMELEDLSDDFDELQECITETSKKLCRFKTGPYNYGDDEAPSSSPSGIVPSSDEAFSFPMDAEEKDPFPWWNEADTEGR